MNVNQIVNMVLRMVVNRLLRRGIDAGIDRVAGKGRPAGQMTPEERRRAQAAKQGAGRARQALRLGRRIGRF